VPLLRKPRLSHQDKPFLLFALWDNAIWQFKILSAGGQSEEVQRDCGLSRIRFSVNLEPFTRTLSSMNLIISWLILSFSVYITALILPGFHIRKTSSVLIIAALFGLLHFLLGWLFFGLLTIATLGIAWLLAFLTRIVVSAIVLVLVDKFTDHLKIDGFKWALLGAVTMSLIGTLAQWALGQAMGS